MHSLPITSVSSLVGSTDLGIHKELTPLTLSRTQALQISHNMNNNAQGSGQQDYLDKAFNAGAKKFGGAQGQKIANNRGMSEKIVRRSSLRDAHAIPLSNTSENRPTECARCTRNLLERKSIRSTPTRAPTSPFEPFTITIAGKGKRT
jgi:hypothetical protein